LTKQEAMVIQDLIGGEIVELSPGEYKVELEMKDGDTILSLYDNKWIIWDYLGENLFDSDEMK
jgi:hypothetical protein